MKEQINSQYKSESEQTQIISCLSSLKCCRSKSIFEMFKLVTVALLVLVLQASARPQDAPAAPPVAIVSQTQTLDGTGNFNYAFESADGIKEEATGSLKSIKVPKVDASGQTVGEEDGQGKVCFRNHKSGH